MLLEQPQTVMRQNRVALLMALAGDLQHHPAPVHIHGPHQHNLRHPQPRTVGQAEQGAMLDVARRLDQPLRLLRRKHPRPRAAAPARRYRKLPRRSLQHLLIKKAVRTEVDVHGRPGQLAHRDNLVEKPLHLRARQLPQVSPVKPPQLLQSVQIALVRPRRETPQPHLQTDRFPQCRHD